MSISKFDLERSISDLEGKKNQNPASRVFAYGPKEHSYMFIALSYQNCRRSLQKYEKMAKNDQFIAVPVEPKIGQPQNICPEVTFSKMHLP